MLAVDAMTDGEEGVVLDLAIEYSYPLRTNY